MIEMLAYTIAGIVLYFASDWILKTLEQRAGKQFDDRNLVFFGIILLLAISSFAILRLILPGS